jgi:hypothetical protein
MTAAGSAAQPAAPRPARRSAAPWSRWVLNDDARQLIAVAVTIAVLLIAGLVTKALAESQTRTARGGAATASIPGDWLFLPGAGDVAFSAADPRVAGLRYVVSVVTLPADQTADEAISLRTAARARLLAAYEDIARAPITIGGRSGTAVTYGFAAPRSGAAPRAIEARDVYLPSGDKLLVVTLESPVDGFDGSVAAFERFVSTVRI